MVTRYMRNATIAPAPFEDIQEVSHLTDFHPWVEINTPYALALTSAEITALQDFFTKLELITQLESFTDTSEQASALQSAVSAITSIE